MPRVVTKSMTSSLLFNGVNSSVSANISNVLSSGTAPFSFVTSIYISDNVATRFAAIGNAAYLTYDSVTRRLLGVIARGGGDNSVRSPSTMPFEKNQWYRVGMTWDGTAADPKIYISGVDVGVQIAAGSGTPPNFTTLYIGNNATGTRAHFGNMADNFLYNRVLTPTEMRNDFISRNTFSGLIGKWTFNEGSGLTAFDTSGSGNNGTITNATYAAFTPTKARAIAPLKPAIARTRKLVGELVVNGDFEYAPPFTAPTSATTRWIDGTAAGSAGDPSYGWATFTVIGTVGASFDTASPLLGLKSLKLSTITSGAKIEVSNLPSNSLANVQLYGIPVQPNTSYRATFFMRSVLNGGTTSSLGAGMDIVERNSVGGFLGSNLSPQRIISSAKQQYTITFTTQATTTYLTPKFVIDGSGGAATLTMDAWFDNFSLMRTTPMTRQLVI